MRSRNPFHFQDLWSDPEVDSISGSGRRSGFALPLRGARPERKRVSFLRLDSGDRRPGSGTIRSNPGEE